MKLSNMQNLRTVSYFPQFKAISGSTNAGLMLQQLLFWWDKKGDAETLYKTIDDFNAELGFSRSEQDTAISLLINKGFISYKLKGVPARRHFVVMVDAIQHAVDLHLAKHKPRNLKVLSLQKPRKLDCGNPANKIAEIQQRITESTSKSNSDNSLSGDRKQTQAGVRYHEFRSERERENFDQKIKPKIEYPSWLSATLWHGWLSSRVGKPMSDFAKHLEIQRLEELIEQGWQQREVLEDAIVRGKSRLTAPCKPGDEQRILSGRAQTQFRPSFDFGTENSSRFELQGLAQEIQHLSKMIDFAPDEKTANSLRKQRALAQSRLSQLQQAFPLGGNNQLRCC